MNNIFYHNSYDSFYRYPFGAVCSGENIILRLKSINKSADTFEVFVRLWYKDSEKKIKMQEFRGCNGKDLFQAEFTTPKEPGLLWYYFLIKSQTNEFYYGNNFEKLGGEGEIYNYPPDSYQITVYKKGYETPSWFKDSIMYQIMTDRFYNGNEDKEVNNPRENSVIHKNWDELPDFNPNPSTGDIPCNDFFGGNFKGVIKKLSYLKELGISVIYFNPIFDSPSNHKYNTGEYMKIDPMFGDEDIFFQLIREAKNMGISIILDGVFSHTGSSSLYFNKEGKYKSLGAYQSKSSPYFKWYDFKNYPDEYASWWGIKTLPEVNEMEKSYQDFILNNDDSVIKHWLRLGVKGWRLDVADELPDEFIKNLRRTVKEADNEAVVIGEVWEDASNKISYGKNREYLQGDELDGVMNYRLKDSLLNFLTGKCSGEYLSHVIMSLYENYPAESFYSLMNMLGTHDTPRIKYVLGGVECGDYMHLKENELAVSFTPKQVDIISKKLKMASLFIMTFPGVPSIYYGDEAGLGGCRDPYNRKPYPWGREDKNLLNWFKKISSLRKNIDALRTGEYYPVYSSCSSFGFVRVIENGYDKFAQKRNNGFVLILLNRNDNNDENVLVDLRKWNIKNLNSLLGDFKTHSKNNCFNITIPALGFLVLSSKDL